MVQNLPPVGQNLLPQDLQNQNKNGPQYFGQQQPQQTYQQYHTVIRLLWEQ